MPFLATRLDFLIVDHNLGILKQLEEYSTPPFYSFPFRPVGYLWGPNHFCLIFIFPAELCRGWLPISAPICSMTTPSFSLFRRRARISRPLLSTLIVMTVIIFVKETFVNHQLSQVFFYKKFSSVGSEAH